MATPVYVLDPRLEAEQWAIDEKVVEANLTLGRLRHAMRTGSKIRVGPTAQRKLRRLLCGMDGTMTPKERRAILEKRRDRKAAARGNRGAAARLRDPSPF